ncbi:MAG: PEGA domain-containing protein [bacterium]|nr:PEGA domain-containing protein [bacterium]
MKKKEEKDEPGIESLADEFLRDMGMGEKGKETERPEATEDLMKILKPEEEEPSYKEAEEKEGLSFFEYSLEEEPLPKKEPLPLETPSSSFSEEPTYGETPSLEEPLFPPEPTTSSPDAFSFLEEKQEEPSSFFPEEPFSVKEPAKPELSFAQEPTPSSDAFSFPEEPFSAKEPVKPELSFAQEPTPSPDAFSFPEEETAKSYEETPFIEESLETPLSPKTLKEETSMSASEIMDSLEEGEKQEGFSELEEIFEEPSLEEHHEHEEDEEYIVEKPPPKGKNNLLKFAVIGSILGIILMAGGYFGYKYLSPKVMKIDILSKVTGGLLKGSIEISSEPTSSDIFVNGIQKGKSPLTVSNIPLEKYEIRITKEGYLEWTGDVELSLKKRKEQIIANLSLIPAPIGIATVTTIGTGTLFVKTSPVAAVYVDGKAIRRMPVILDEGVHTITVSKDGYYTFRRQIEITSGEKLQVVANLSLKAGSLFIDSIPRFAEVIFEGQSKGKTPVLIPDLPSFQAFRIKIKKEGFAEWRGMTFTEPSERTKIMALLEKKTEGEKKEPEKVHYILPKKIEGKREEQEPSIVELKKQIIGFEKGLKFPEKKIGEKTKKEEIKFPEWTMDEIIPSYSYSEPELFKMPEPIPMKEKVQLPLVDQGPGYCFITSVPAGAEILVDGRSIGKTPIRSVLIPAGKHTLTARKEGFREEKKEVAISGEATNFFNIILPK